jgi:hypothetical protein
MHAWLAMADSQMGGKSASDDDDGMSTDASAPQAMTLSSDEVNFLLYRYLQESGASTQNCTRTKYQDGAKGRKRFIGSRILSFRLVDFIHVLFQIILQ